MNRFAVCFILVTWERMCLLNRLWSDVPNGVRRRRKGMEKQWENGKAVGFICRPICLAEQTGSLSSSQEDDVMLPYTDN